MNTLIALAILASVANCLAFGGDDRYIKKYAMMKVYESCLGPDVVKEVRKEMKTACAKCSGVSPADPDQEGPPQEPGSHFVPPADTPTPARKPGKPPGTINVAQAAFDPVKLQQAILGFRAQQPYSQSQHFGGQPLGGQHSGGQHLGGQHLGGQHLGGQHLGGQHLGGQHLGGQPLGGQHLGDQHLGGQHLSGQQLGGQQPLYRPFQQQNSVSQGGYYPQQFPEPLYYPTGNSLYNPQAYPVPFNPFYQGQQPFYPQGPAYFGQRSSRDLDLRGQLETLTSRIGGKIRNVTCVMQELGYLDENLEPNFAKIHERIGRLPVTLELKRDMADGVEFCKQFSQCVPDIRKDKMPLSRELVRPMFFFRCYKHKKLEACIMKDVRERYSQSEDLSDEDAMGGGELRSLSWDDAKGNADSEDMATAMYEFLYGGDNMEFETLM